MGDSTARTWIRKPQSICSGLSQVPLPWCAEPTGTVTVVKADERHAQLRKMVDWLAAPVAVQSWYCVRCRSHYQGENTVLRVFSSLTPCDGSNHVLQEWRSIVCSGSEAFAVGYDAAYERATSPPVTLHLNLEICQAR